MTQDPNQFDDPELKSALQRLHGEHRTSDELRHRVEQSMRSAGRTTPIRRPWLISRIVPWAIAAVVALAVVGGWYSHRQRMHHEREQAEYLADNRELFAAMVNANRSESTDPEAIAITPQVDLPGVVGRIASRLGRAVPSPNLASTDWQLTQASVVTLANLTTARFDFHRDQSHLVLVSMPTSGLKDAEDGEEYEFFADQHPIAGYISHGTLNCFVGDPSIPLDQVVAMRDKLRGM